MGAWKEDKRLIIELMEDAIPTLAYVRGVLDVVGQNEGLASKSSGLLEALQDEHKKIRTKYLEQGRLFDGREG